MWASAHRFRRFQHLRRIPPFSDGIGLTAVHLLPPPEKRKKCRLNALVGWASGHQFHQSHISTVFIEYTESAPFHNPVLRN
ncbi:hypothetical protein [Neisseria bergeri]|uniref:hypothetical protein n=1 Tax=Neisseria bergeri TaxID=1906581 RepID=UPI00272C0F92|nr:hypothetical protein [Neisseria bergeri]